MIKKNGDQGEDPPVEYNSQSSPFSSKDESSATTTDSWMGDKRKELKTSWKKRKADISSRIIGITNYGYNLISYRMEEIYNER